MLVEPAGMKGLAVLMVDSGSESVLIKQPISAVFHILKVRILNKTSKMFCYENEDYILSGDIKMC